MSAPISSPLLQPSPSPGIAMAPPTSPFKSSQQQPIKSPRASPSPTTDAAESNSPKKRPLEESEENHASNGDEDGDVVMGEDGSVPNGGTSNSPGGSGAKVDSKPKDPANPSSTLNSADTSAAKSNKRRKLTQAEKEEREKEKAAREKEKAEKQAERDEKKRLADEAKKKRDEEKKQKDEERRQAAEEKERKKEEERKQKEEEKRLKEEEKAKKDKAQTRLSNFFGLPKGSPTSSPSKPRPKFILDTPSKSTDTTEPTTELGKLQISDYKRCFHPFFIKQNVVLAPQHSFARDDAYKAYLRQKLDDILFSKPSEPTANDAMDLDSTTPNIAPISEIPQTQIYKLLHIPEHRRTRRGQIPCYSTKELLTRINNAEAELNLGTAKDSRENESPDFYLALLKNLPKKHLQFAEDVRPPYSGTFTKIPPVASSLRKGKNPFERSLPNINYDYDSEAEWIAPEEEDGEDLMSEMGEDDEEELVTEDGEEMEEFLDDEEDGLVKRANAVTAPLQPFTTGLGWEDSRGRNERRELQEMKMGILLDGISAPIDPFSTHYWLPPPPKPPTTISTSTLNSTPSIAAYLNPLPTTTATATNTNTNTTTLPITPRIHTIHPQGQPTTGAPKKLIPPEDLDAFKAAIAGSDMTKAGLVEVLKKKFPKASKDAIRETLGLVAVRVGGKEADKRWVLR